MNYENGTIYKIACKNLNIKDVYVGSTIHYEQRINHHRSVCNNPHSRAYNFHVYDFIRQNGGFENWQILLIEYYPCKDRHELQQRERVIMEELNAGLNVNKAYMTPEELKISKSVTTKKYYKDNIELCCAYGKKYYLDHKELYHNKYYDKEKAKERYKKEKVDKPKTICQCGSVYINTCKTAHNRTKKHINFLSGITATPICNLAEQCGATIL